MKQNRYSNFLGSKNYVITRDRGVISDCAIALDVFIEMTEEEVRLVLASNPYWRVWDEYRTGIIGWNEWLNHPVHKTAALSFIKNPSKAKAFLGYKS